MLLLALFDESLDRVTPLLVRHLGDVVAVLLQRAEVVVESKPGVAGQVHHTWPALGRVERSRSNKPGNVVDRHHVDGVANVRTR